MANKSSRSLPLRAGDDIAIRALHSDRVMYRWRRALVEEVRADRVVTYAGVGGAILSPAYGRVVARDHVRSIFYLDRPYSVFEFHHTGGRPTPAIYVNMNAPAEVSEAGITYVDHELDVAKNPGRPALIVDEDEFVVAIAQYGYSPAFQEGVRAAAEEGLRVAESWRAGPVRHDLRVARAGDLLRVRKLKHDGRPYRWWRSRIEDITDAGLVTTLSIGQLVCSPRGASRSAWNVRFHYWFERPYSLLECYDAAGQLYEIYVDISKPARLRAGQLEYVDYELDVSKLTGQPARIVDADEFEAAICKYRYSMETQRWARATADEALDLAETWEPRGWYEEP
jgi:protein associated with RNAse G/E